jgi:hypothetical protein
MLQWLYTYVASAHSNVLFAFSEVCCKCAYFDVAYVLHICCKFYLDVLYILQWLFQVFSCVFSSVLDACFNYFICLHKHVANASSGCFKSRLTVATGDPPVVAARAPPSECRRPSREAEGVRAGGSGGVGDVRVVWPPHGHTKRSADVGRPDTRFHPDIQGSH